MRHSRRLRLLLLIGLFAGRSNGMTPGISLTLFSDKQTFVNGEMIYLEATVENLTSSPVEIPKFAGRSYRILQIVDMQGNPVPYHDFRFDETSARVPGKGRVIRDVSLIESGNGNNATGIARDFIPGRYRVWIEIGKIKSNILEITIAPRSSEEELVHRRLNEDVVLFQDMKKAIAECFRLLNEYPNSVFLPNIYWELITLLSFDRDAGGLSRVSLEFIRKFPNFGGLQVPVSYYRSGLERELGITRNGHPTSEQAMLISRKLNELKAAFIDSKVARYVDSELENARKEWSGNK
jgi:hypothetical protein